ncbi:cytochrome P450 [Streptosporangium becharense]|uniref:Cytochrome P450 n=1 Tax=Streptosporangium becharense TaxID=1816182 RepID=A0A7W9II48_9ACTN|nr:cytochrome P450 [Streptosporangium becharense]MBB2912633.1 cytochrome P450 [Streptosporangium becharense]MBB5820538.1 cytochrome P450 [Streptosporangium becharense]
MNHETRLHLAAHPVAYPLIRTLARLGPVVRVPGLGVVVNDAATARAVLTDERFRKDGPGSPGDLWTPVLGPSVLLNMEGPAHLALRRKLMPLFTTSYVSAQVDDVLNRPLADLSARLDRGETVDLVDAMRVMAGAVICRVIGLGEVSEARARELFADGERVVSMVSLRSRRLSEPQVAIARRVLDRIGDIAQAAYEAGDESTVMGRMRAQGLSAAEARGAAGAFFLTGTETVATFVPRLIALLHDHGVPADAVDDLDRVIEEAMRVTTPTPVMLRSVSAVARVGRVTVRPGDRVLIVTHNCARAYGPFDPSRGHPPELRRIWFGAGPHFCIGYPLALAEIRAVASVLLTRRVRVVRRRAARRVLIPTYEHLWISAA